MFLYKVLSELICYLFFINFPYIIAFVPMPSRSVSRCLILLTHVCFLFCLLWLSLLVLFQTGCFFIFYLFWIWINSESSFVISDALWNIDKFSFPFWYDILLFISTNSVEVFVLLQTCSSSKGTLQRVNLKMHHSTL